MLMKGMGKGKGKGKQRSTARKQAEEFDAAWWDPHTYTELSRDVQVSNFMRGLGSEGPVVADGKIFVRDKSLVSCVVILPLKIAKGARHGLHSASVGGLRSFLFRELPPTMLEDVAECFAEIHHVGQQEHEVGVGIDEQHHQERRMREHQFSQLPPYKKARGLVVLSTLQETGEAISDIVSEAVRLVEEAAKYAEPLGIKYLFGFRHSLGIHREFGYIERGGPPDEETLLSRMNRQRSLHDAFAKLLWALTLDQEEVAECKKRGIDEQTAQECLFRTWNSQRTFKVPCLHRDSGDVVTTDIILRSPGLLIPCRNAEGLITALQFRLRSREDSSAAAKELATMKKAPRYMWVSKDKSFKGEADQVPFFCVCPRWSCRALGHRIALVEGGLKAYAFAFLARRFPVIGAAGGQWHECGQSLLHALARLNVREVLLFPDAGATQNPSVILDYLRSLKLLELDWGFKVLFVWWGQVKKSETLDPDEQLLSLRCARELHVDPDLPEHGEEENDDFELPTHESLEATPLTPAEFWAQVSVDVQLKMCQRQRTRLLLSTLKGLLGIEEGLL